MRANQLQSFALLIVSISGCAYSGIQVQTTRFFSESGVSLQLEEDGEFALTGHTGTAGLETAGPPLNGAACFIARFSAGGERRYYRYIAGVINCTKAAFRKSDGSIWLTASPSGPQDGQVTITADLAPDFEYRFNSTRYLLRLDVNDGSLLSVTRFPSDWMGSLIPQIGVDSAGAIWLGGYASGPFPDTPDAAFPLTYIPGFTTAGTLMRLSPEGDRILYATHTGGRAVAALAIDSDDNIYVVGLSIQKLSNAGRPIWTKVLGATAGLTISVNPNSGVFVGGCTTFLEGFPATENAFQSKTDDTSIRTERFTPYYPNRPCVDGFVARFSGDGDLIYATLIGGVGRDAVNIITVDNEGWATLSGFIESRPTRLKDLYWVSEVTNQEFIARLSPDGAEVEYFTNFLLGASGSPGAPFVLSDGHLVFVRLESKGGETAGSFEQGLNLYTVRSVPSTCPRVDFVEPNVEVTVPGLRRSYAFEIRGEGFGDNPEVWLDAMKLELVASAPGKPLQTVRFSAPLPLDTAYFHQLGVATYNLTVKSSDGSISRPVLVTLQYVPVR